MRPCHKAAAAADDGGADVDDYVDDGGDQDSDCDLQAIRPCPFPSLSSIFTPSMHGLLVKRMITQKYDQYDKIIFTMIVIFVMTFISQWSDQD